ncbi:MAG: hypothetical protein JWO10_956 [Microbacteriaceae bacterium]|nr:hypothetical protein [Microbacteriaceae bacterium]
MPFGSISAMGHMAFQTTKLEQSVFDATKVLGLREVERVDGVSYLAAASVHHELMYIDSAVDGVDHIGLVARDEEALADIHSRVVAGGYTVISEVPLETGIEKGFAFIGPEDFVYEIYLGMHEVAPTHSTFGPDRFGHINLHPKDVNASLRFLEDILDFRVSDVIGDDFAYFLRCNADHHGIALIAGRGSLHHHAWQTQNIADLGKLGDRLDLLRRQLIWGPVRHGAGHNIAAYFIEPVGDVIELYTDLEQIYDDDRPPVIWGADDNRWFNRWGAYRGQDFRDHGAFPVPRLTK